MKPIIITGISGQHDEPSLLKKIIAKLTGKKS